MYAKKGRGCSTMYRRGNGGDPKIEGDPGAVPAIYAAGHRMETAVYGLLSGEENTAPYI